jgi:hypothetical protein
MWVVCVVLGKVVLSYMFWGRKVIVKECCCGRVLFLCRGSLGGSEISSQDLYDLVLQFDPSFYTHCPHIRQRTMYVKALVKFDNMIIQILSARVIMVAFEQHRSTGWVHLLRRSGGRIRKIICSNITHNLL